MSLFKKRYSILLKEKDDIYKNIISKLPTHDRIDYCESLIHRTQKDILLSKCPIKKRKLKKLLKTAEKELKRLKQHINKRPL